MSHRPRPRHERSANQILIPNALAYPPSVLRPPPSPCRRTTLIFFFLHRSQSHSFLAAPVSSLPLGLLQYPLHICEPFICSHSSSQIVGLASTARYRHCITHPLLHFLSSISPRTHSHFLCFSVCVIFSRLPGRRCSRPRPKLSPLTRPVLRRLPNSHFSSPAPINPQQDPSRTNRHTRMDRTCPPILLAYSSPSHNQIRS